MELLRSIDYWPEARLLSYEAQRLVAMAPTGGSDPGEVAWAVARIDPANRESWRAVWAQMAEEVEGLANSAGSKWTRRDALLRSSNYWRQAAFFIPVMSTERLEHHINSQRCFREAMPALDCIAETVEIPYEDSVLDGYLLLPEAASDKPCPVVIYGGSVDSTAEEKYFSLGKRLVERGIGVLLFDGPGQGASLLQRKILARHDYEVATAAAIDWLVARKEVDGNRIGMVSWGFGGHYTLRSAAFEPRLAAGVAWNMCYTADDSGSEPIPSGVSSVDEWKALADSGKLGNPILARYDMEWNLARSGGTLEGVRDYYEKHTLEGILGSVKCPILLIMGEEDSVSFHGDGAVSMTPTERALNELGSEDKTLIRFPANAPGSRHIQADGMERGRAVIIDWIDNRLNAEA